MPLEPSAVGAAFAQHHPAADGGWIPAETFGHPAGKARAPVHGGHQSLRVDQLRLQLDDEQAARGWMPGEDIDDATLAIDREADLSAPLPGRSASEQAHERLVQIGVRRTCDALDVCALPAQPEVEAGAEGGGDGSRLEDRYARHSAALEPAHGLTPKSGAAGDIGLAKTLADAQDTQGVAQANVVHRPMMGVLSSPALCPCQRTA